MSAPVTEAHIALSARITRENGYDPESTWNRPHVLRDAQLIADSEAKAVAEWQDFVHLKGEAIDSLLLECNQLRAEVERWEAKCHELIAPHYIIDPCLRAAKFREALALHPVIRKPKKEKTK